MATQVKHRRGSNSEILAATPAVGELWFNTTDNSIHMGDGVTPGGIKHVNKNTIGNYTNYSFASVATMKLGVTLGGEPIVFKLGMKLSTGVTDWKVVSGSASRGIDIAGGFKATPLNGLWAVDYGVVGVFDYNTNSGTDDTAAIQAAIDDLLIISQSLRVQATQAEEANYRTAPKVALRFGYGLSYINGSVVIPVDTYASNISLSGDGYGFVGTTTNIGFDFQGSANKNHFENIVFARFVTGVKLNTSNVNEAMVTFTNCQSMGNDTFVDTVGYTQSRSTMVEFKSCTFSDTRRVILAYTDNLTFNNCWTYAKYRSNEAQFYLSGDGNVEFNRCFFIPHGEDYGPKEDKRFIDFVCDPAQGSASDRSLKHLELKNCRFSLESTRGLVWFFDLNPHQSNQGNIITSIKIKDTYLGGLGGQAAVIYKVGYPVTVSFENAKFLSTSSVCSVDPANTKPPTSATPEDVSTHTISVDEETRANLAFSGNGYLEDSLKPFLYSTTAQTSRFKRSFKTDLDYRLPSQLAPGAGANLTKVTIPVFFDKTRTGNTPCRDAMTFMLTLVSDARGQSLSNPTYSATSTSIVTITGDSGGGGQRVIQHTVLQDAKGGINAAESAAPVSIHWGTGDTGLSSISVGSLNGDEDNITVVWGNTGSAAFSWAYILPLAGSSDNTVSEFKINGVW